VLVMGVDIGTTGVKGIAFDENGVKAASAYRSYPILAPKPGYLELASSQVIGAVRDVISGICRRVGVGRVKAVASSALGEAVVPLDDRGRVLYNTITAVDSRARNEVTWLEGRLGKERFYEITGQPLHPITTVAKLLWWKNNESDVFASADKFLCWNDMFARILGLEPAISPSLAARTGLYDLRSKTWSEEILDLVGLEPERLARIVPAGEIVGAVDSGVAAELGLAEDCVLVSGGWDQACAALGSGATEPGVIFNCIGSTDSLNASFGELNTSAALAERGLSCTPHVLDGLYCTVAYSMTGGNLLEWYRDRFGHEELELACARHSNFYDVMVENAFKSTHPIMVLAHFAGTGTPYMNPTSMGAMLGLTLATEKCDVSMGILEGICFEMALNLDNLKEAGLPVRLVLAGGGGARNERLLQLRSNVFDHRLTVLENEEAGCYACGMLATTAVRRTKDLPALAESWIEYGETIVPDPAEAERYRRRKEIYAGIYPALADLNARIRELSDSR